ncbi:MAG: NADH-quinone oxidoreductase subunit C [Verrucomicrobiae bacterium]|nr:NADH-quinone oxidoreductase subunit C [Verrucomicrobiae bacterium]
MNTERFAAQFPQMQWDAATSSWIVPHQSLLEIALFLKTDPEFRMDLLSNVAGVDWLSSKEKVRGEDGKPVERERPGYLEVVYHFYSVSAKQGPIVLRCRTDGRATPILPSITPLYRSAEFQEREIYDLYGIVFSGHPDLRRILMWDEFEDFPMRKDYVSPDDYEWEPTPHDDVLERARQHRREEERRRA